MDILTIWDFIIEMFYLYLLYLLDTRINIPKIKGIVLFYHKENIAFRKLKVIMLKVEEILTFL